MGIHHITTISSNPQKSYDFYVNVLGLRMVKKTVNFDAPDVYHLYFADEKGNPGTLMTLFPFPDAGTGMRGVGQVTKIMFSIPMGSISYWIDRFIEKGVKYEGPKEHFGNKVITFYDFDGLQLELVMNDKDKNLDTYKEIVPEEFAVKGFFGAELSVGNLKPTEQVLTEIFNFKKIKEEEFHTRYESNSSIGSVVDIFEMKGWPEGIQSAGTVHHIAFRATDDENELDLREKVLKMGLSPTDVIDRKYFHSVYFREPGGILFEIATDPPGMNVDEDLSELGEHLMLPEMYENRRDYIETILPPIKTGNEDEVHNDLEFFYEFIDKKSEKTLILFHGTGADERDLIPLAYTLDSKANILTLRGNIDEHGMLRFFRRKSMGEFDEESIFTEIEKLDSFLEQISKIHKIDLSNSTMIGLSNGANFALSYILKYKTDIKKIIAFHPTIPFEPTEEIDLRGKNILLTSGENDPYLRTPDEIERLKDMLENLGAKVEVFKHEGGHELREEEVEAAQRLFSSQLENKNYY